MMKSLITVAILFVLQVSSHGNNGQVFSGDPYSSDGCGESRGCLECEGECEVNIAWEPDVDENVILFTMWGAVRGNVGHVSLGISTDEDMFSADVYSCITNEGTQSLKRYRTAPPGGREASLREPLKGVSGQTVSFEDGEIRCQFTRNMSLDDNDPEFYNISGNSTYYLLWCQDDALSSDGDIEYHDSRGASTAVVLSLAISGGLGDEDITLMQVHGILMIIAWIGLARVGIIIARYYKPMWPKSKLCGEKVWFALHRFCMVSALLLFIIAFIIIFVHVDGFVENNDSPDGRRRFAHAICGVLTVALGIINPILALFRPHPGTRNRPIFNWTHWGVGTLGYTLAVVSVALALAGTGGGTIIPGLAGYSFWVLIGFICFDAVILIILEVLKCYADSAGRSDDIPLGGKDDNPSVQQDDSLSASATDLDLAHHQLTRQGAVIKNLVLFIYILGNVFTVAFLLITIAIV